MAYDPEYYRKWRGANPEKVRKAVREHRARKRASMSPAQWASEEYFRQVWSKYRIRPADFTSLVVQQEGRCAACEEPMKDPVIDHCHSTGRVRGLLCARCNSALGLLRESPEVIQGLLAYSRKL